MRTLFQVLTLLKPHSFRVTDTFLREQPCVSPHVLVLVSLNGEYRYFTWFLQDLQRPSGLGVKEKVKVR